MVVIGVMTYVYWSFWLTKTVPVASLTKLVHFSLQSSKLHSGDGCVRAGVHPTLLEEL